MLVRKTRAIRQLPPGPGKRCAMKFARSALSQDPTFWSFLSFSICSHWSRHTFDWHVRWDLWAKKVTRHADQECFLSLKYSCSTTNTFWLSYNFYGNVLFIDICNSTARIPGSHLNYSEHLPLRNSVTRDGGVSRWECPHQVYCEQRWCACGWQWGGWIERNGLARATEFIYHPKFDINFEYYWNEVWRIFEHTHLIAERLAATRRHQQQRRSAVDGALNRLKLT